MPKKTEKTEKTTEKEDDKIVEMPKEEEELTLEQKVELLLQQAVSQPAFSKLTQEVAEEIRRMDLRLKVVEARTSHEELADRIIAGTVAAFRNELNEPDK